MKSVLTTRSAARGLALPSSCVATHAQGLGHRASNVATRAIKLYTNPGTRGKMCEWTLAELGLEYEEIIVDTRKREQKSPAYLAINPFGMVPALVDGDQPLFESGAILIHLANKYGKLTPDQLGLAAQWTLFANSTFSEAFFAKGPTAAASLNLLSVLEGILSKSTYITGETFGVADVALAGYLLYLPQFFPDFDLTPYPSVWRYMQAAASRPTCPAPYQRAMQEALARKGGAGGLLSKLMGGKK